jgi:serine phosphatase RsbU (regulator of sigma subunit)
MGEQSTENKINFLEEKLLQLSQTAERADVLNELSWNYRYSNINKARNYTAEAFQLSQKLGYKHGLACAMFHKGLFSFWLSLDENYLSDILAALHIFEEESHAPEQVNVLNILGNLYDNYGDYEKAISACRQGIDMAGSHGLDSGKADCLTTMGQIYSRLGDFDLAIQQLEEGLNLRTQLNEQMAVCSSLNLIARIYLLQKNYAKSEEYYNKSLEYRTKINDIYGLPWTYLGLATLYEQQEDYNRALVLYNKGIEMNQHLNEKRYQLMCLSGIGNIQVKTGDVQTGIATLEHVLQLASEIKAKPLMADIHKELALAFETTNKTKQTLFHYKQFITLKEEVLNTDTNNKLKKQQIAFSVEKAEKEAEIFQLRNVELKKAYDIVEQKNTEIISSLNYAKRIQDALAPSSLFIKEYLTNSFILYKPKDVVSGDFYWIENKADKILFAAVDCTGHGVPGAFVSIIGHNGLNRCVNEFCLLEPAQILDKLTELVIKTFEKSIEEIYDGMDIALCSLNLKTNELEYAGANNSLYCISNGELLEIKADKRPIGRYHSPVAFTNHKIQLKKGDLIYVFSDGYADQFGGENGKKFKSASFKELLLSIQHENIQRQREILLEQHLKWKGNGEQTDDICVIGVKV